MVDRPDAAPTQLLRLLHLASPALPIGAFHFSQGLEYAVDAGWVVDEVAALAWVAGLATGAVATLDLPVLARLHAAWCCDDTAAVAQWNAQLIAMRETAESRAEDLHMGSALAKVLADLDMPMPDFLRTSAVTYATLFALACARWQVNVRDTLQAYAWAWAETQVLAAIKLVPLGQRAGQRMLHALIPILSDSATRAMTLSDEDIGISGVMQAFASASHETQYTRLFRS
jgi:urease accessory protein